MLVYLDINRNAGRRKNDGPPLAMACDGLRFDRNSKSAQCRWCVICRYMRIGFSFAWRRGCFGGRFRVGGVAQTLIGFASYNSTNADGNHAKIDAHARVQLTTTSSWTNNCAIRIISTHTHNKLQLQLSIRLPKNSKLKFSIKFIKNML